MSHGVSLELIGEYLPGVAGFLKDPEINELRINPNGAVFVERRGANSATGIMLDQKAIGFASGAIAGEMNLAFEFDNPRVDARLEDGSRIALLRPPITHGYVMTIRRFPRQFSLDDLVETGSMPKVVAKDILDRLITQNENVVVSGGTSSGKTTFARAVLNNVPVDERMILIEQPSELNLDRQDERDLVMIEARDASGDTVGFSAREAVRAALRHSPKRIVVGEVRGGEAFDFIDALNTGHGGSLTTVHASSAHGALQRLVTLVKRGSVDMPYDAIFFDVANSINMVVHLNSRRQVAEVLNVLGTEDAVKFKVQQCYCRG